MEGKWDRWKDEAGRISTIFWGEGGGLETGCRGFARFKNFRT